MEHHLFLERGLLMTMRAAGMWVVMGPPLAGTGLVVARARTSRDSSPTIPSRIKSRRRMPLAPSCFAVDIELAPDLLLNLFTILATRPPRAGGNVNTIDEVPDSGWFTNRIWAAVEC